MDSQARVGAVLDGRYRLDRLLGEGGMGSVYRARHLAMEREVAVKVLRGNLASDPTAARRFALEAKATTRVDSPHAVKVFDFGITADGEYYMVMEYLDGRTAQRELDVDGPMAVDRAVHVARQAAAALGAAHQVGVVHRDIKPENLLLSRAGDDPDFCKVLDFGVAKLLSAAGDVVATALTKEGMVFGTPDFMSPEQACGQPLDGRSDLYSLAATLFTLLTGKPLFSGRTAVEILSQHVLATPPRLIDQPGAGHLHALDQVLQRALAKQPERRHRDAAELARDLAFLAPARGPAPSLQGAATVPTPVFQGRTPDSPLGVLVDDALAGPPQRDRGATGATPLIALDLRHAPTAELGVAPSRTGYLPRVDLSAPFQAPPQGQEQSTRAMLQHVRARRRWVVPAALAAALLAGAVGWLAARGRPAPAASSPAATARAAAPPAADTGAAASPIDAGATPDAEPRLAQSARDAGAPRVDAAPPASTANADAEAAAERTRRLRKHLTAAAAARDAGNLVKQLAEATFALELAPRDPGALLLAGDALVRSADLSKGCKYLRRARTAAAAARAEQAGCP